MRPQLRTRFWLEAVLAGASGFLFLLTLVWRDWIEVSGWDPDHHNGTVEYAVAAALLAIALVSAGLARGEWHRAEPAAT